MKKNEPLKNVVDPVESDKHLQCQKCKSEFVILLFEELPEDIHIEFNQIMNKLPSDRIAFFFYCRCCDEFSILYYSKN